MTLHLVRHGESTGNRDGVIQGTRDVPLTEHGRAQAQAVAQRLGAWPVRRVYTSPLRRARDTAQAIGAALGVECDVVADLSEYRFGAAEGLPWAEVQRRWRLADGAWGRGDVPGEEGTAAFRARVAACVAGLLDRHADEDVVAVVHGGVVGAAVATCLGVGDHEFPRLYAANGGITSIGVVRGRPTVLRLNDCCHLAPQEARAVPQWQAPAAPGAPGAAEAEEAAGAAGGPTAAERGQSRPADAR